MLPSLFLVAAVVAGVVLGSTLSTVPFVCFGTYLSWLYLRLLQPNPELKLRCGPRSLQASMRGLGFCQRWRLALCLERPRLPTVLLLVCSQGLCVPRGDALNNDFRFATFFPEVLHPVIDNLTGALSRYTRLPGAAPGAAESPAAGRPAQLPGSDRRYAARRR